MSIRRSLCRSLILASSPIVLTCAASALAQDGTQPPEIVVEGKREAPTLQGGEWKITLSASSYYGRWPQRGDEDKTRPVGSERSWYFCIPDVEVAVLMRALIGEGMTQSSGTTFCRPLAVTFRKNRVRARQMCTGGTIPVPLAAFGAPLEGAVRLVPAIGTLSVLGRYDSQTLTIEFDHQRQSVMPQEGRPPTDGRRWSVKGVRVGLCEQPAEPPPK